MFCARAVGGEQMRRGEDRVFGAVKAAVAIDGPGCREELHGPLRAGGARAGHPAEIGLDEIDRRQVGPSHPGRRLGRLVVGTQLRQVLGRNDPPWGEPGTRRCQRHQVRARPDVGGDRSTLRRRHPCEHRAGPAGVCRHPQAGQLDDQGLPGHDRGCGRSRAEHPLGRAELTGKLRWITANRRHAERRCRGGRWARPGRHGCAVRDACPAGLVRVAAGAGDRTARDRAPHRQAGTHQRRQPAQPAQ